MALCSAACAMPTESRVIRLTLIVEAETDDEMHAKGELQVQIHVVLTSPSDIWESCRLHGRHARSGLTASSRLLFGGYVSRSNSTSCADLAFMINP